MRAAPAAARPAFVEGELILTFERSKGADVAALVAERAQGHIAGIIADGPDKMVAKVQLTGALGAEKAAEILANLPGIRSAEPNWIVTKQVTATATSNDPSYTGGQLWGMYGDQTSPANNFGSQAGEAWATGKIGSMKVATAVIDSGVDYTHPDLYLNIFLNQGEIPTAFRSALTDTDNDGIITFRDLNAAANSAFVTDVNANGRIDGGDLLNDSRWENGNDQDGNGYVDDLIGWDFQNGDNDPMDDDDHGTHVAGTIAAMGGNGVGVAGVAWQTQVVPLKFLGPTGGTTANGIRAIDYFTTTRTSNPGVDFVATNNSWGGGGFSQALLDSIVRGAQADILFVAAAGNGGSDGRGDNNDSLANYPSNYSTVAGAGYEAVIAVAALTSTGALAGYSNFGRTTVDLAAPGSGVLSTVPGGGYATFSGTSMATPHVSGAIALFAAANGGASAAAIRSELLGSTAATTSVSTNTVTGGRLDVTNFLDVTTPTPTPTPTVTNIYGTTGSDTVRGTTGNDKIWGVPATGTSIGRGTIDQLFGNGGNDTFVLGDSRGVFYNDGNSTSAGTSDYALIRDFNAGDLIQLSSAGRYFLQSGATYGGLTGTAIWLDSNANGRFDNRDELIGHVAGVTNLGSDAFVFG